MTTKTKTKKAMTKKPVKRATRKRAVEPDLSWLDAAIHEAEQNLERLRMEDFIRSLADCSEAAKSAAAEQQSMNAATGAVPGSMFSFAKPSGVNFACGARRMSRKPMYHLVPIELMQAVADTRQHGDLKYAPGNWKRGDNVFFVDCVNHCIEHLWDATGTDSIEDIMVSLGHAATNIGFMLWALRRGIIERKDFERAAVLEGGRHG